MPERYLLHLDFSSPTPVYAQLVEEVKRAVARGHWKPDEKIPSVRELAIKLGINPNTVAKSYDELVAQGVVRVQRGVGVFVAATPPEAERRKLGELAGRLERVVAEALAMNVPRADLRRLWVRAVRNTYGTVR